MDKLELALKKQKECIEELKNCKIYSYNGFGKDCLLIFDSIVKYPDGDQGVSTTQRKINEGYYQSVEDFDSYHSADIEFTDFYLGEKVDEYRKRTKVNLINLGKKWRQILLDKFPEADITIIIHKHENDWFLDTFNYHVNIKNALYL